MECERSYPTYAFQISSCGMVSESVLYAFTLLVTSLTWPLLWSSKSLTTLRVIILIFVLDTVLTIEAAFYSDVVVIAVLHIITIPIFFGLIYFDLIKQHRSDFRCFICGRRIETEEPFHSVQRSVDGKLSGVMVHESCIRLDQKDRKKISRWIFKKGIPK